MIASLIVQKHFHNLLAMNSVQITVLVSLCLTNALYTVIRKESVKYEKVPTEEGE
jgi:hypothetical protein